MCCTIEEYFCKNYGEDFIKKISEISKSQNKEPLVKSDFKAYSFDDIVQQDKNFKNFHSVDAIVPIGDKIILIEFKTGFEDRLNIETFKLDQYEIDTTCAGNGQKCKQLVNCSEKYFSQFYDMRCSQKEELISSLKLKLYDSMMFINKVVLPCCNKQRRDIKITYIIVVDSLYIENKFTTITGMENNKLLTSKENVTVRDKMEICKKLKIDGDNVLCDDVEVELGDENLSNEKFSRYIHKLNE